MSSSMFVLGLINPSELSLLFVILKIKQCSEKGVSLVAIKVGLEMSGRVRLFL